MSDGTRLNLGSGGDLIDTDEVGGKKQQRIKVGFGVDGVYSDAHLTNPLPVIPSSLVMAELSAGNLAGYSNVLKFGQNNNISSGNTEDIWDGGGIYNWPISPAILEVVSTNAGDAAAGIGAQTIMIEGFDANYSEISEMLTMNGLTPVLTTNSYLRVFRMYVLTAGVSEQNGGDIKIQVQGGGVLVAQISATNNQTQMSLYTVPAGKTFFINAIFASIYNEQSKGYGEIEFRIRLFGTATVFREQLNAGMATDGTTSFSHTLTIPLAIPEKTDMLMRATATVNNTKAIASFGGFLKDN